MPPAVRRLVRAAGTALSALAVTAPGAAHAAASACDGASADPGSAGGAAATLCLVNHERTSRGLAALTESSTLDDASARYARAMVGGGFFAHESPGGSTLLSRLKAAGWLPASGSWTAGENIAWGSGDLGTPGRIVAAWMASPGHRANILQPAFTEIGLGIAEGAPQAGITGPAATYVTDFGGRSGVTPSARGAKRPVRTCARASRARHGARRCRRR